MDTTADFVSASLAEALCQTVHIAIEVNRRRRADVITLRMELRKLRGVGICTHSGSRSRDQASIKAQKG